MRTDTIKSYEQKASGGEVFDTNNTETRNRERQPPVQAQSTVQMIFAYRPNLFLFAILIPVILMFYRYLLLDTPDTPKASQFPTIDAPSILIIGKTGSGKSSLGNLLLGTHEHKKPTFNFSSSFLSHTKVSGFAPFQIGNETYNIVDTPGVFDTDVLNEDVLEEIAQTIQNCAYGIKAILFVIKAERFTEEQRNMVNMVKLFLGHESLQYMISVFSFCDKKQTEDPEYFRKNSWNEPIKDLVNSMGSRWAISPNPDIYPPNNFVRKQHLEKLKNHIISTDGVYTNELLEKARKKQEENARIEREKEEERQREYDELKRSEGEAKARENYERQRAEDMKKANERYKNELENIRESLLKQINYLHKELSDQRISGRSGSCFGLETQVKLESGRIIQMSELQTGDRVLSNIRNGIAEYSEVYLIAHIGKLDHEEEFAKVNFTRPDGSKGQLRLTITHYVFDENLSIMFAKDLRPGETKILVLDDNNKLVSVFVDDVTIELHDKYISFYTRAGSVIANGVLCSCYDQCPPSQTLMDLVFLPIRWWTYIIPSTYREEQLHPYVQFLETVYFLFINTMENANNLLKTTRSRLGRRQYENVNRIGLDDNILFGRVK